MLHKQNAYVIACIVAQVNLAAALKQQAIAESLHQSLWYY